MISSRRSNYPVAELPRPGRHATPVANAREQQVRLPLVRRQFGEHAQNRAVSGHASRQFLVQRRAAVRLVLSKTRVHTGEVIERIVTTTLILNGSHARQRRGHDAHDP